MVGKLFWVLHTGIWLLPLVRREPCQHTDEEGDQDKGKQSNNINLEDQTFVLEERIIIITSVVKGSKKATRDGGAALGLT